MIPATQKPGLTDNYIASSGAVEDSDTGPGQATARQRSGAGWQRELAAARIGVADLLERLQIPWEDYAPASIPAASIADFPLRVTESFASRMRPGDLDDPLLRQILPTAAECEQGEGYSDDPLSERMFNSAPGLIHKYRSRALLIVTQACAVHCRYCFRKHFPYRDNRTDGERWAQALQQIASDKSISEVILSGGDPLASGDRALADLFAKLATIEHVKRLRIHTRLPVVLPSRVDGGLLQALEHWPRKTIMVLHSNHAAELDASVAQALRPLAGRGITLLNQAVLLRGVNDCSQRQVELAERLFECGVLPYYLHQLDKVSGTSHFEVSDEAALRIHSAMRAQLSGYLLPALVRELPGKRSKTPLY